MDSITIFEYRLREVFEAFEEAMDFSGLRYSTTSLGNYGFHDERSVHLAVNRAIRICKNLEMDPKRHFRSYYKVDMANGQASREWRVSKLGFYLLLCNGDPENRYVAALQLKMLREFLKRME